MTTTEGALIEHIVDARLHLQATIAQTTRYMANLTMALNDSGPFMPPSTVSVDDVRTLTRDFDNLVMTARRAGIHREAIDAATRGDLRRALELVDPLPDTETP